MTNFIKVLILICALHTSSCSGQKNGRSVVSPIEQQSNPAVESISDTLLFPAKVNSVFYVSRDIDLKNNVYVMPKGVTLVARGGLIKNGTLIGNDTKIENNQTCLFKDITIYGKWDVEYITTSLFNDLNMPNSLKNLFALANENVNNKIVIDEGNYTVSATEKHSNVLKIPSHTEVVLNGSITLTPNGLTNYSVMYLEGSDIIVHGRGAIVGDKHTHTGSSGEWGMGIQLSQCTNVTISDITIKKCWGDCIYVGRESKNVSINNCYLDNGRRQGISITSGSNIIIENCVITNVSGTAPQYAIDVEPNRGDTVRNVVVKNVKAIDCVGGYLVYGGAENALVDNVTITSCSIKGASSKYPIMLMTAENVTLHSNNVISESVFSVLAQDIEGFMSTNNNLKAKGLKSMNIISCKGLNVRDNN